MLAKREANQSESVKRGEVRSYSEAGVEPEGGAVLILRPLAQAGPRGADVLARPLAGEDPLVQAACGQNVLLVQAAERQTEDESEQKGGQRGLRAVTVTRHQGEESETHGSLIYPLLQVNRTN